MPIPLAQIAGETVQAVGSQARMLYLPESSWGTAAGVAASRKVRLLPGESLDQNFAVYESKQIRDDRTSNPPVLGSQDPGGDLPFELSPEGWNWAIYHLLGGSVTKTGPTGGLANASAAPTGTPSSSGGTLQSNTYFYVYTAINASGETLPSTASTGQVVTGPTGSVSLAVTTIGSATGYNVYRSTSSSGPFLYAATSATSPVVDKGAFSGSQPPPSNTTGAIYTHSLSGATTGSMPVGFTIEKGFLGIATPVYQTFLGSRINSMSIQCGVDAIPTGRFGLLAREFTLNHTFTGAVQPSLPVEVPYTGAFIAIYEGVNAAPAGLPSGTGTVLGICNELTLNITNNYFAKRGFILGDTRRQNLKPGTRMTTFTGKFMFQNADLYAKATGQTPTALKMIFTSGSYSHMIDLPNVRLTPNGSAQKISDDGPLEFSLAGKALLDPSIASDILMTISTAEPDITV